MLHMRRRLLTRGLAAGGSAMTRLADRFVAADPGFVRLAMAVRGTLSVLLASLAAGLAVHVTGIPIVVFAGGVTFSLMGPFLARDPTMRQRQRTLAILVLPAAAMAIVTALLHGATWAGDLFFLALVFACYLLQSRHPRNLGLGLVAVVATYVDLFLQLPPATLPAQLAGLVVGAMLTAVACFVLVPMTSAATLRRTVRAVQWRSARVLQTALHATETDASLTRLRRQLARLNEAALAADDQLALLAPDGRDAVRSGLIEVELATARLIDALQREKPGPRHALRLLLQHERIRRGYRFTATAPRREMLSRTLAELGRATQELGEAAAAIQPATEAPPAAALPPGPLAWRVAIRASLAAGLAMAGGMALSPQRWFWAVITVYVVFLNARSRGDIIYKGAQRLGGTLLGLFSGLVLATLLAGNPWAEAAVLLAAVFGMYFFFLISYTIGIFCVTVMLGLLYGALGASVQPLLELRLEETAIGAAAAILVSVFVLPARTRDQVMRSGRGVLTGLAAAVAASRQALAGVPSGSPMAAMRRVDRQVADLRLALAPITARRALLRRSALERPVPALFDCVHWTRVLAAASESGVPAPGAAPRAAAIEARLARLAGVAPPAEIPPAAQAAAAPTEVAQALDRLDRAVEILAERLEIGALEGFALDP
jgi:uncharacterized membrane protein YccC